MTSTISNLEILKPPLSKWVAAALLTLSASTQAAVNPDYLPALELEWNTVLKKFQVDSDKFIGQRFFLKCPPKTVRDTDEPIRGTQAYPSDTPICVAAVHAGAISTDGGLVSVQLNPGQEAYRGSLRHGIASTDFPRTQRSITFVDPGRSGQPDPTQRDYAPRLKWDTKFTGTGLANRNLVGQRFMFNCPSASGNLTARRVYGTDRYAFNSYICQAAVHAGRITHDGGFVLVQLEEGVPRLEGSIRNGIESKGGSGGSRTITFAASDAAVSVVSP